MTINVSVAYATPDQQVDIPLQVTPSCTVALAIRRSGVLQQFPEIAYPDIQVGIFSRKVALDAALCDGDRIEIYRDLLLTPIQARQLRAKKSRRN